MRKILTGLALLGAVATSTVLVQPAPAEARSSTEGTMRTIGVKGTRLEYCSNGDLAARGAGQWQRAVVMVHGSSQNACDYARYALRAADRASGVGVGSTLVVAPHFDESSSTSHLNWDSGWREGDESRNGKRVSSYAAVDRILKRLANSRRFPNLGPISVAGHSAGGQFVQRYAAGNSSGVRVSSYVVANPSSYLYLDERRWASGELRTLTTSERSSCSGYNRYKYGMDGLNAYMGAVGTSGLVARYRAASVTYLLGSEDTDTRDSSLDRSCEASWQGAHRYQRGSQYVDYLDRLGGFGGHDKAVVPGAGHSAYDVFTSPQGQQALFG